MKQVLSYGGGVQSVAMVVLVARGELERPDAIIFADTGREVHTTIQYARQYIIPLLASLGMDFHIADHSLSTVDLYGKNGDLLLPAYTNSGKLPSFCSGEWKREVVRRYCRRVLQFDKFLFWIGFSLDEKRRATPDPSRRYPLLELNLTRSDCEKIITDFGLPIPNKSRCFMCPHQSPAEWAEVRMSDQWQDALAVDEEVAAFDDVLFLHPARKRLKDLTDDDFTTDDKTPYRQCGLGLCYL